MEKFLAKNILECQNFGCKFEENVKKLLIEAKKRICKAVKIRKSCSQTRNSWVAYFRYIFGSFTN